MEESGLAIQAAVPSAAGRKTGLFCCMSQRVPWVFIRQSSIPSYRWRGRPGCRINGAGSAPVSPRDEAESDGEMPLANVYI